MKVLYIEDDANQSMLVKLLLTGQGYEVEHYALGKPGLERFLQEPDAWDATLIDLVLPDMSGEEIIPQIFAKRPLLPIIVHSGTHGMKHRYELYSSGASALVPKPCEAQDLLDVLAGLIETPPEPIK
jgi:DNA-binding response OmpR family regulator